MTAQTKDHEVTIKDLAKHLSTDPRSLRAFVRGMDLGCGRGTRYVWPSMSDATVKRIVAAWKDQVEAAAGSEATG